VGQGTDVKVFLPTCEPAPVTAPDYDSERLRGGDETILVVEDEAAVRDVITQVLRSHGYRVIEASDGPEAFGVWAQKGAEVDLLVTDIVMPNGIKGNVLAERLKALKPDLKVIFSSGYSCDFATGAAPLDERFSFLEKPYRPEVLVRAVRECLDS
jgi:two-component system, cell cycle sensor histidine kinase and response regulator CckA